MTIFLIFACAIGIFIFVLPYFLISANPFPQPSGKWKVGTADLIWDKPELSGIIAKVWYPTETENDTSAPYIDRIDLILSALTVGMNPLFKFIFNKRYFARIRTPASIDAIPATSPDGFPVIFFSPGLAAINFLNTFYALEFASHGFIVVGINHPGSSFSTMLTNGAQVGVDRALKELLTDPNTRFDRFAGDIINQQAAHISIVLDKVINLNHSNSFLEQRIDLNQIFAAGHSIGGAASFIACGIDRRISKGVNFDGYFLDNDNTNYDLQELLLINSDRDRYPKNKALRIKYEIDLEFAKDKVRIEHLAAKANLGTCKKINSQKLTWDNSNIPLS